MPGPEAAVARVGWVEVGGDIGDGAQGCRAQGNRCPVCLTSLASHHTRSDANILSNFGERGSHVKNIEYYAFTEKKSILIIVFQC